MPPALSLIRIQPLQESGTILQAINTGRIKKLVVIVINARADPANTIYQTATRPGVLGMIEPIDSHRLHHLKRQLTNGSTCWLNSMQPVAAVRATRNSRDCTFTVSKSTLISCAPAIRSSANYAKRPSQYLRCGRFRKTIVKSLKRSVPFFFINTRVSSVC